MGTHKIPGYILKLMRDTENGMPKYEGPPPPPMRNSDEKIIADVKNRISYLKQTANTFHEEVRDGKTFKYWKNRNGTDLIMERSDGDGYINLVNQEGKIFAAVLINFDSEDSLVTIIGNDISSMLTRWLIDNPSSMIKCWYNRRPKEKISSLQKIQKWLKIKKK
tara:strand:- start:33 stop:524 length:492 start_codon:yes stop_codon:yes gene_type:complete